MDRVENTNNCHYKFINCKTGKVVWEGDSRVIIKELAPYSIYGAVDKYDALIRRKYLEMHRKLWNWIADETKRTRMCVYKFNAFVHFGWRVDINNFCWACKYTRWKEQYCSKREEYVDGNCSEYCLIDWGRDAATGLPLACANMDPITCSAYDNWSDAFKANNWENAAKYAREIANLPERK